MSGVLLKRENRDTDSYRQSSHVNIDIRVSEKTVNPGTPRIAGDYQAVGKRQRTDVLLQILPFSRKKTDSASTLILDFCPPEP